MSPEFFNAPNTEEKVSLPPVYIAGLADYEDTYQAHLLSKTKNEMDSMTKEYEKEKLILNKKNQLLEVEIKNLETAIKKEDLISASEQAFMKKKWRIILIFILNLLLIILIAKLFYRFYA